MIILKKHFLQLVILLWLLFPGAAAAAITEQSAQVEISTGVLSVHYLKVDLNSQAEIAPVMAQGGVGAVESLSSMAGRTGAAAAINGTFFNSYSDMQPQGTLQTGGVYQHLADGAAACFYPDRRIAIQRLKYSIEGSINGSWEYPDNWYAWGINHCSSDPAAIEIFTPLWAGGQKSPGTTVIVVKDGEVAAITGGNTPVPANGFLIGIGPSSAHIAQRFKIGDRVNYRVVPMNQEGSPVEVPAQSLSAGPLLVADGELAVDFARDGMTDPKITTASGARSFLGLTADHALVMGTTPRATIRELAEAAKALGLVSAMNLDGGASSGLYFRGSYLTTPGRNLSNCLAVIERSEPAVTIKVNGVAIAGDAYVAPPGITMIPARGVLEKMGAGVSWDDSDQSVGVSLGENRLTLRAGSSTATVNGSRVTMQRAAEIIDGRTYIPLRFVAESLGARVGWDQTGNTVTVSY